ncbi:MAG: hypothetical protein GX640_01830, partial [Fibrobacter sp.]|nr:hypothetical protein [Fibrobacter sp.]
NRADDALGTKTTKAVILGKNGFREEIPTMDKGVAAKIMLQRIAEKLGA